MGDKAIDKMPIDEAQERRKILVIYYIELRTQYFNHFAIRIYDILKSLSLLDLHLFQEVFKDVEKIYALSKQQIRWTYSKWSFRKSLPYSALYRLIEQSTSHILPPDIKYLKKVGNDIVELKATIAKTEKRSGLFPDDGLFELFKPLTNDDIRVKIEAENERIKTFLTIIEDIMATCYEADVYDIYKIAKGKYETFIRTLSVRSTPEKKSSRFSLGSSRIRKYKIEPLSPTAAAAATATTNNDTLFEYSQQDLSEFIKITDAVFDCVDIVAVYLTNKKDTKGDIVNAPNIIPNIKETIKSMKHLLSNRKEYIKYLSELITVYIFKPATFPTRYSKLDELYENMKTKAAIAAKAKVSGGRIPKKKDIKKNKQDKTAKPSPSKPKTVSSVIQVAKRRPRIRLRFP
uniref:Uncharacterized protein n=1 Tax=viral metagenome TaxID=1070528 RepID=A0A6C0LQG4_9ZZZZ